MKQLNDFVYSIEQTYGVIISIIGYDRYDVISGIQKQNQKYNTVETRNYSNTLYPPTKFLLEKIADKEFQYEKNTLLKF